MPWWLAEFIQDCLDFSNVLNASIAAGWMILVVLVLRVLLKKAPKWTHVALWGLVAVRLLLPFSVESTFSLIPSAETIPFKLLSAEPPQHAESAYLELVSNPMLSGTVSLELPWSIGSFQWDLLNMTFIWLPGIGVMLLYAAISYWLLHRKVQTAVLLRENIYQSEFVTSPFVLGIFKPKIYLPFSLDANTLAHVVAHEQAHIHRRDHWWKPLGFLLLAVHWFNPLMWLAYVTLCRDIELACDETVIRTQETEQRADYSQALLLCSAGRKPPAACPLAFGEVSVKNRVKSIVHYQKPAWWIVAIAVTACVVTAVCFVTNPIPKIRNPWVQEYIPGQDNILGNVDTEQYSSISADFAIGADRYGRAVFKDPYKAFDTFTELYAEGIALIQTKNQLLPMTKTRYEPYKRYGWQITTGSQEAQEEATFVTKFLDIYENSFTLEVPNTEYTEPTVFLGRPSASVSKKSFRPAVRFSKHFTNVSKTYFIEREGGFLPPSHFPRCSIAEACFIVYRQTDGLLRKTVSFLCLFEMLKFQLHNV